MKNFFAKIITVISTISYTAEASFYVVKPGDTLSVIAQKNIGNPVYAANGSLEKLVSLNPKIRNPNLIRVGDVINLTENSLASANQSARIPAEQGGKVQSDIPQKKEDTTFCAPAIEPQPSQAEVLHSLRLRARAGMTTFSAIDALTSAAANIVSKSDLAVRASWRQNWTPRVRSDFFLEARSVGLQNMSGSKSLLSENLSSTKLGLSLGHEISQYLSLDYSLEYGSEFFIRGASSTLISVEAQPVPQFSLQARYKLYEVGSTSLMASLSGTYLGGTSTDNYTIKVGNSYQVGIGVVKKMPDERTFSAALTYSERTQDTSQVFFHEKSVYGTVSFSIPLFEGGGGSK